MEVLVVLADALGCTVLFLPLVSIDLVEMTPESLHSAASLAMPKV
jgi:hypothetical protein